MAEPTDTADPRLTTALVADNRALRAQVAALAERVEALEQQNRSREMLVEAQRLARLGSFELDVATLMLTWSEQQFRNFGFDPARSISRARVISRIHPDDQPYHEAVIMRAVDRGEPFSMVYRVVHPGGSVRLLHTVGQPVFGPDGRVARLIGTSQDITELRTSLGNAPQP